jgi:hypothetical protein
LAGCVGRWVFKVANGRSSPDGCRPAVKCSVNRGGSTAGTLHPKTTTGVGAD